MAVSTPDNGVVLPVMVNTALWTVGYTASATITAIAVKITPIRISLKSTIFIHLVYIAPISFLLARLTKLTLDSFINLIGFIIMV